MRIVLNELKKIWNLRLVAVSIIISTLFYMIFMRSSIELFRHNHSNIETFDYAVALTERYGSSVSDEEIADFIRTEKNIVKAEMETYIEELPIFAEVGVTNLAEYEALSPDNNTNLSEKEHEAYWTLLSEEGNHSRFKMQALNHFEEQYDHYPKVQLERELNATHTSSKENARLHEVKEQEEYRSIVSGYAFENTINYSIYLAILTILLSLVMVSPLIINDRSKNIHFLQYSARNGRDILKQQGIAVTLSAFLITTVTILIFGAIYAANGTYVFWNNGLTSFLNNVQFFWFELTYGQYLLLFTFLLYALGIGTALFAFVISRFSSNLIAAIMKLIPVFGLLCVLCSLVFNFTFSNINLLYELTGIVGVEAVVVLILFGIEVALSIYTMVSEKHTDVF